MLFDQKRVHDLFSAAKNYNIRIVPMTILIDDLKKFLYNPDHDDIIPYSCILLLDATLLNCKICHHKAVQKQSFFKRVLRFFHRLNLNCFSSTSQSRSVTQSRNDDFVGHYILLVGYDRENDLFYYRDPGCDEGLCCIDSDSLDVARSAIGTDHDVIVVKMKR